MENGRQLGRHTKKRLQSLAVLGHSPETEARLAVEALYKYHLTDTATHRLIRVRRQGVSDDTLLETVTHLHNEGELVIDRLTVAEEWRLICSMGFAERV